MSEINEQSVSRSNVCEDAPWRIARLVFSILAILLGIYLVDFASKYEVLMRLAAAFSNKGAGATGAMLGYLSIAGGAVGVYAFIKKDVRVMIVGPICYIVGVLFSLNVGLYKDLYLYDAIVTLFAVLTFIPWLRARRSSCNKKDASAS